MFEQINRLVAVLVAASLWPPAVGPPPPPVHAQLVVAGSPGPAAAAPVGPAPVGSWWQEVVASQRSACGWLPPVDAPVVDPFRPPGHPYGPGNRGIEYGTAVGDEVVAVADGRVVFVGPVAGRDYLVIGHDDGLRSTYGPLTSVAVIKGQAVGAGQAVALADEALHLTARSDDRYLDPAPFLDGRCLRPRLVPLPALGGWGSR